MWWSWTQSNSPVLGLQMCITVPQRVVPWFLWIWLGMQETIKSCRGCVRFQLYCCWYIVTSSIPFYPPEGEGWSRTLKCTLTIRLPKQTYLKLRDFGFKAWEPKRKSTLNYGLSLYAQPVTCTGGSKTHLHPISWKTKHGDLFIKF